MSILSAFIWENARWNQPVVVTWKLGSGNDKETIPSSLVAVTKGTLSFEDHKVGLHL